MFIIKTKDGYVVDKCKLLLEACQLRRDLYEQDRRDGTFEAGYYRIVRVDE